MTARDDKSGWIPDNHDFPSSLSASPWQAVEISGMTKVANAVTSIPGF
jgi:hypothetical protein